MRNMSDVVDPNTLWINPELVVKRKSNNGWGKLRIKKDRKTGKHYFDILLGLNGRKDWHTHFGITLTQELLFKEYRDQVNTISRKVESSIHGIVEDKTVVIDSSRSPRIKFIFKPKLVGTTAEVTVDKFEVIDV